MFELWYRIRETGGYAHVAREFKRPADTVRKYAIRNKWDNRAATRDKEVRERNDRRSATAITQKIRMVDSLQAATFAGLFEDVPNEKTGKVEKRLKTDPTPSEFITVARYGDTLREKYPPLDDADSTPLTPEQLNRALDILSGLGKDGLKALGDYIVRNNIRIESENGNGKNGHAES